MKHLLSLFGLSLMITAPACAKSIEAKHRVCKEDSDCEVVLLGCHCMYCARPDDQKNSVVDAVNRNFAQKFKDLSKCSKAETQKCATAGACAMSGKSEAVCKELKCTTVFKANSN